MLLANPASPSGSLHPTGATIAQKTLNPRMGVDGGISVLGTTGLVEPWDDHLTESTMERIAAADRPVLTTGRVGLRFSRLLFPDREVILIGGKLKDALDAARGDVILCGLPALILRHINPQILDGTGYPDGRRTGSIPAVSGNSCSNAPEVPESPAPGNRCPHKPRRQNHW